MTEQFKQKIKNILSNNNGNPDDIATEICKVMDSELAVVLLESTNMREIFDAVGLQIVSR